MIRNRLLVFLILCSTQFCFGQYFSCEENFTEIQEKAKKENGKVLLYFSGSDWCKPCIMLKKRVLKDKEFQKSIENKYMVFQIDFPQNQKGIPAKEIKCRESMAAKFNENGIFPKLVLIDENQKIIQEINGYSKETPEEILNILQK